MEIKELMVLLGEIASEIHNAAEAKSIEDKDFWIFAALKTITGKMQENET